MGRALSQAAKAIALLGPCALAACNLAPAHRPPTTVAIAPAYKEAPGWSVAVPSDAVARGAWWELFGDPALDALESKVEVTNQTVAQYRAAYAAARALVRVQRSALFPTVTGQASAGRQGSFGNAAPAGSGGTTTPGTTSGDSFALQIGASWEPDLWGRLGNGVNQARANAQASAGDLANATLSARGELATDYLALRGIDAQRALLDLTCTAYARALAITRSRYGAGSAPHSDVFLAQTALDNAEAERRDLDRQRALLEHAIAVLAGENPSTFALAPVAWQPMVPEVPSTIESALLQRRPDIAAAERRVAAANANIGIQRAAFFPAVTLSGDSGLGASSLGSLFAASSSFWSVGISGLVTLLDFGARQGQVDQARAQFDAAGASYRQTVLTGFQQVEDNLAAQAVYADVARVRDDAADAANRAEGSARAQYLAGTVDYSSVIVAQTAAYAARQNRIQSVVDRQTATVALIQAIGGKWPKTGAAEPTGM